MTPSEIAEILRTAETTKTPCPPIRKHLNSDAIQAAYKIQKLNIDHKLKNGQREVGKKIGLTSKKVQAQLGVDQPDFGILLNPMQIKNGQALPFSELMQPKVEAEVAFVLKKDLTSAPIEMPDVVTAIDYAVAAIEIVGSRVKNWDITIADTIADNASSSHFVLGEKKADLQDLDLENCKMKLDFNGKTVSEGQGKACLGNPLNAVLWLANKMQELGNPLKAGEVILSGALGPMVEISKGEKIEAEIDGLGKVGFSVT